MTVTNFPIAVDGNDGGGTLDQTTWPPTGGTFATNDLNDFAAECGAYGAGPTYYIGVGLMRWDTGATIPAGATITAANLLLYSTTTLDDSAAYSIVGQYFDFGGEPTVTGDVRIVSGTSIFTAFRINTITTSAVRTIALTDLTGIKRAGETNAEGFSGITGIKISTNNPGAPAVATNNSAKWASREHATGQEPQLEVTYTLPAGLIYNPKPNQSLRSR